ncbi:hypothetical protein SLEP1_g57142 [Rubroshorea leprosula]|uniref:Uncharacterized protein n=1 Tax=Rubroshorea leprosula TaxID=152421 RepID=A0AAV5MN67_9ROSI|nr:hypothetical protein SLEP1_g57142 [Rubroshorea leprosula]
MCFFCCSKAWRVWTAGHAWWGINTALISSGANGHFLQHTGLFSRGSLRGGWSVVWFTVL